MKKTIIFLALSTIVLLFVAGKIHAQVCGENAMCIDYSSACSGQEIANSCEAGMKCCQYSNVTVPDGAGSGLGGGNITGSRQDSQGGATSGFGNPIGESTIEGVLGRIMGYLKGIAGTIAVIFIIIGGIMYMLSAGNKDMAERGKKTVTLAMAGLAIVVAAPTFYREIMTILGGSTSNISGLSLQQIAMNVLRLLLSLVGFLAIISMIIGSVWMFSAAGDEDRYELGKKTVTYSIVGIIIAVASLIIVNQIKILIGG